MSLTVLRINKNPNNVNPCINVGKTSTIDNRSHIKDIDSNVSSCTKIIKTVLFTL